MKIATDVYKISGDGNVYVLVTPEPTVIDTGCPAEREKIRTGVEKILPLEKIRNVILTHLHYDHCGNVNLFPNATFYSSKEEIQDMKKRPEVFFFGTVPSELKKILYTQLKETPRNINGLKKIFVPGHTRGSLAFLDEKRKLLFSGDTLFHNAIGRYDFPNSIPKQIPKSVTKLLRLIKEKELTLCPGHDY